METDQYHPQVNGTTPSDPDERLLAEVRELGETWRAETERLSEELELAEEKLSRYEGIEKMLTGEAPAGSKSKKKKKPASKDDPSAHGWTISDERVEFVYNRFLEEVDKREDKMISPTVLADATPGISGETVRKAFMVLRERELIRAAANIRGGGTAYALMPQGNGEEQVESDAPAT